MVVESQRVIAELRRTLPAGKKLLVAVSGGLDSMVLLHGCLALKHELGVAIEVAHVDHGLRSVSSDDATFVSGRCAEAGIPFHLMTATPGDFPDGIEAWGRRMRYDFFARILQQRELDILLTAHHANDRAETVLMRFLGNREPSSIHAIDVQRCLVRPLLALERGDLEEYARSFQVEFRLDASNDDPAFLRNRYRNRILPYLERELSTNLIRVLADRARSLEDDAQALEQAAREKLALLEPLTPGSREWLRELRQLLQTLPTALGWRLIERVLADRYGDYLGRRTCLRVSAFIQGSDVAIEIPGARRIRRSGGGLEFH